MFYLLFYEWTLRDWWTKGRPCWGVEASAKRCRKFHILVFNNSVKLYTYIHIHTHAHTRTHTYTKNTTVIHCHALLFHVDFFRKYWCVADDNYVLCDNNRHFRHKGCEPQSFVTRQLVNRDIIFLAARSYDSWKKKKKTKLRMKTASLLRLFLFLLSLLLLLLRLYCHYS